MLHRPTFNTLLAAGTVALTTALAAGSAAAAGSPTGVWLNDTGRGAIEIKNCKTGLCGHVVWVKNGSDAFGCGKQILGDVKDAGGGTWEGGWIYSPERKRRFDVELEPQSDGTLKVTGFAGVRFLSKTMIWKPAPANLVRCNSEEVAAAPEESSTPAPKAKSEVKTAKVIETDETSEPVRPPAKAKAKAVAPVEAEEAELETTGAEEEVADAGEASGSPRFNLEDGIEIGDVVSIKKASNGKCKIKAPFVDLIVDCDRAR